MNKFYTLPELPYSLGDLDPIISEKQLSIHYEKHHKKYVDDANMILKMLDEARSRSEEIDEKAVSKVLSFNVGGHVLHSLFWKNMCPESKQTEPSSELLSAIEDEFGSLERFKQEFNKTAISVEGSGWAALTFCKMTGRPIICQIEKHNVNLYPSFQFLLVLDVWEHAYYLDYQNNRSTFVESFWKIVDWDEVNRRLMDIKS